MEARRILIGYQVQYKSFGDREPNYWFNWSTQFDCIFEAKEKLDGVCEYMNHEHGSVIRLVKSVMDINGISEDIQPITTWIVRRGKRTQIPNDRYR